MCNEISNENILVRILGIGFPIRGKSFWGGRAILYHLFESSGKDKRKKKLTFEPREKKSSTKEQFFIPFPAAVYSCAASR